MKNLIIILSFSLLLVSCSHKMAPPAQSDQELKHDSSSVEHSAVLKDSLINIPGDSAGFHGTIGGCPELTYHKDFSSESGKLKGSVNIDNGIIDVDCKADSLKKRIQWLEWRLTEYLYESLKTSKTTTVIKEVPVIKMHVPKWCWYLLGFTIVYFGLKTVATFYMPAGGILKMILTLFKK